MDFPGIGAWIFTKALLAALVGAVVGLVGPYFKITRDRQKRIEKFEEQLPDAIDAMKRALRVGHQFPATLKLVAGDMDDPISREVELTFADINYGSDVRRAMLGLLQRMPSVTVMALITSVRVQKETGGNLAEILEQISSVIRSRFALPAAGAHAVRGRPYVGLDPGYGAVRAVPGTH